MEHNLKLVKYFTKHFYSSDSTALEHLASLTFSFIVDNGKEMDFFQYVLRKDKMKEHIIISFDEPVLLDDDVFKTRFKLDVPRVGQKAVCGTGEMLLSLEKNLLKQVIVNYDQRGQDNKSIQAAIKEVRDIKDGVKFV